MRGAMKGFGVSHRQVMRWVERGMAHAVREDFQGHWSVWWLTIDAEAASRIDKRRTIKSRSQEAKLPHQGDAS